VSATAHEFGWLAPLDDGERAAVQYAEPGVELTDGDWYLDATSPKRGPTLAMEGDRVPVGGVYILRSAVGRELFDRLSAAAAGKL
jgi:hypothetical protein